MSAVGPNGRSVQGIKKVFSGIKDLGSQYISPWKRGIAEFEAGKGAEDIWNAMAKNANGEYDLWELAKMGSGLAVGYRAITGGGVYRDKNGNFDVAGVPFV